VVGQRPTNERRNGGRSVGVVIRALNESERIGECLDAIFRQRGSFDLDVLVVDSGSTDGTVDIAKARGGRIVELSPGEFDYSTALNVGIGDVRGELVISISAHAVPVEDDWLERMTGPFGDPKVAGVSSRQVPWPDAPWQEVHRLRQQFSESPRVHSKRSTDELVFSNAASCLRRQVWQKHRFTLPAVEDLDWAHRVIDAGWTIVYEPRAAVYHSHVESARAQALRMIDINRVLDGDSRLRTRRRTLREALGLVFRESRKIIALDEPVRRKRRYLVELIEMAGYYVLDFSKAGTTAERRGAESARR
jgi:glycosyltransferase involved in cell wall biosynthesis